MRTVYKYVLEPYTKLELPKCAEILSVNAQHNDICLWALVDPDIDVLSDFDVRHIVVFGTGHEIVQDKLIFIDTVIMEDGDLVFHVFEAPD